MELIGARIDSLLNEVRESDNIELGVTENYPLKQELELTYQSTSTKMRILRKDTCGQSY